MRSISISATISSRDLYSLPSAVEDLRITRVSHARLFSTCAGSRSPRALHPGARQGETDRLDLHTRELALKPCRSPRQQTEDLAYHLTEHLRLNGIYWGLTALCLMDRKDALDREEMIAWVMRCWDEAMGALRQSDSAAVTRIRTLEAHARLEDRSIRSTSTARRPSSCDTLGYSNPRDAGCHGPIG